MSRERHTGPVDIAGVTPVALDLLVVEDDHEIAEVLRKVLSRRGHRVAVIDDGARALELLGSREFDLVISDVRLPGVDGLTLLRHIRDSDADIGVILMSAFGTVAEAVDAVKNDAAHYLSKPFALDDMITAVAEVEARFLARKPRPSEDGDDAASAIIGDTPSVAALRAFVRDIAASSGPVLITGETGTGKELVAATIHALSERRDGPLVAVNCAAFPDTLLEAELFGHERGAFTGAVQRREGRFRSAHGGTLFLDEIADMSPSAQAKLLRVLESGAVQPLGSDTSHPVDVRIVSATNADPDDDLLERMREDLFYRVKMFHIRLPPLRARMADLPLLIADFLSEQCGPDDIPALTPRAWSALQSYDYPGNVRELRSAIGHAVALAGDGAIDVSHLPHELHGETAPAAADATLQPLALAERAFQRDYISRALEMASGNKTRAAELLGISRKTLWKKLRDLDLS